MQIITGGPDVNAVDFISDIEPILQSHCFECHGADEQSGQLRLDRRASMLRGGDSGERAIVPGDSAASFLVSLIKHHQSELEMPPGDSLSVEQIGKIETWIDAGASTPESYGPDRESVELDHWAFQGVTRPTSANSIDGFIHQKLLKNGLQPSPIADRLSRIRRLFLVMHGLPPSEQQVASFVANDQDDAWETLVDQVLASERYGERWATHWLDLVRFAETHGFEMNRERPTAWHYRDWVIESLNQDKPYDQFIRNQIAGDAFGDDVGTGFLVAGPVDQVKGQDPLLGKIQRQNELDDIINTCGTALLGLTTGCARCHNHKFDPISQKDYYAMQAVFAGVQHRERPLAVTTATHQRIADVERELDRLQLKLAKFIPLQTQSTFRPAVNAERNVETFQPRRAKFVRMTIVATNGGQPCIDELQIFSADQNVALAANGATATSSGDFQHPMHKLAHINDGKFGNAHSWISAQATNGWVQIEFPSVTLIDRIVWARDRRGEYSDRLAIDYRIESSIEPGQWQPVTSAASRLPFQSNDSDRAALYVFTNHPDDEANAGREWLKRLEQLEAERSVLLADSSAWIGSFSQPNSTYRLYRGEPDAVRERVGPDAIEAFTSLQLPLDAAEQQRRVAFADWVASDDNPLTARVIVNRLWQFHFGVGIVDTPSDFGLNGTRPTHPELLDWLASELVQNGWSLKYMHRLILNSRTWQQSSRPDSKSLSIDGNSRLLWRFPPRRLEAEAIRDSILAAAGVLDLERVGGPGFSAFEVQMENVRHYHAKQEYGPEDWRRMIYMTKVRQEKDHVFGAFDCPDATMAVAKRSRSTTPLQAFNLLNSRFVMQQAERFANRLRREASSSSDQVVRAFELCFQRPPTQIEIVESEQFITAEGLVQFARAILNANEFVFIP